MARSEKNQTPTTPPTDTPEASTNDANAQSNGSGTLPTGFKLVPLTVTIGKVGKGAGQRAISIQVPEATEVASVPASVVLDAYNTVQRSKSSQQGANGVRRALESAEFEPAVTNEAGEVQPAVLKPESAKAIEEAIAAMIAAAPLFVYGVSPEKARGRKSGSTGTVTKKHRDELGAWGFARTMQGAPVTREQLVAKAIADYGYTAEQLDAMFAEQAAEATQA